MEIVLALRTTGTNARPYHIDKKRNGAETEVWPDEVIAFAIVDAAGTTLWDKLYRPARAEAWPAMTDNLPIQPQDVEECGLFADDAAAIQAILDATDDSICMYDGERTLAFLELAGIKPRAGATLLDVGSYFAEAWGVPERDGKRRRQSLAFAADAIDYELQTQAKGALPDAQATLALLQQLDGGWNCHVHRFQRHIRDAEEKFFALQLRMSELDSVNIQREGERRATDAECVDHLIKLDDEAEDIIKDVRRQRVALGKAIEAATDEVEKWCDAEVERSRRISRAWPVDIWKNHQAQQGAPSTATRTVRVRR